MSETGIFVDFGSTYTKVTAFDLDRRNSYRTGQGGEYRQNGPYDRAQGRRMKSLKESTEDSALDARRLRLACSSAAGGLRLVVIGLVPSLSLSAGRMAALGAGAKLVGNYSYKLNQSEIKEMS